jgi:hypothetical protein
MEAKEVKTVVTIVVDVAVVVVEVALRHGVAVVVAVEPGDDLLRVVVEIAFQSPPPHLFRLDW